MAETIKVVLRENLKGILELNDDTLFEVSDKICRCNGSVTVVDGYELKTKRKIYFFDLLISLYSKDGKRLHSSHAEIYGMPVDTNEVVFGCDIILAFQDEFEPVEYAQIDLIYPVNGYSHDWGC